MVKIDKLNFSYDDKKVFNDLFLNIEDNEKVSIIGNSGCGKSTLLNIILGVNTNYSGSCKVFNQEVDGINSDIGVVFQKNGLFEFYTIFENLQLTGSSHDEIIAIAKELDIEEHLKKFPKALSGGQLQRSNIARTLLLKKHLLLLDEPTSKLDEFTKEVFQKQVMKLLSDSDFGYILVTHDIKEALVMSQRIIILSEGKIKKEFVSPFYGKTDAYLEHSFNDLYLKIKMEFYD